MSKIIVITGASSGIGKSTAVYFARKGWQVAATMRSPEKETDLSSYENIHLFRLDVTKPEEIRAAQEQILQVFGSVDVLLNNAGYALNGPLELSTEEQIKMGFEVNVFGLIEVTKAFLPVFRKKWMGLSSIFLPSEVR